MLKGDTPTILYELQVLHNLDVPLAIFLKAYNKNKKFLLLLFLSSQSPESSYFAFFLAVILLGIFRFLSNILILLLLDLFNFRYYLMVSTLTDKNVLLFTFTSFLSPFQYTLITILSQITSTYVIIPQISYIAGPGRIP